jgi:hypothetical protein
MPISSAAQVFRVPHTPLKRDHSRAKRSRVWVSAPRLATGCSGLGFVAQGARARRESANNKKTARGPGDFLF